MEFQSEYMVIVIIKLGGSGNDGVCYFLTCDVIPLVQIYYIFITFPKNSPKKSLEVGAKRRLNGVNK